MVVTPAAVSASWAFTTAMEAEDNLRGEKDMTLVVKSKTSVTHLRIILDVLMNVRKTQKAMTESGTTDSAMLG